MENNDKETNQNIINLLEDDYILDDEVCRRILEKFSDNGPFTWGKKYDTPIYACGKKETIPMDDKALGKYIYKINNYGGFSIYDVPESLISEEFFINTFVSSYKYIENNIGEFDRNFFKSLIMSDEYSLSLYNNCFEIMPLEYIDEEMVSLAILFGTSRDCFEWLFTVCRRKPQVISEDVWKLAAKLYGGIIALDLLEIVPKQYKDKEWYLELLECLEYDKDNLEKGKVLMDYVPKEYITSDFLLKIIDDTPMNVEKFNEYALEIETEPEIELDEDGTIVKKEPIKIWQYLLNIDLNLITKMNPNNERKVYCIKLAIIANSPNKPNSKAKKPQTKPKYNN